MEKVMQLARKTLAIGLWAAIMTTFVWFFWPLADSENPWDKWGYVFINIIFGSAGFTYLAEMYQTPWQRFSKNHLLAGIFIAVSIVGFGAAFFFSGWHAVHDNPVALILAVVFAIIFALCVLIIAPSIHPSSKNITSDCA